MLVTIASQIKQRIACIIASVLSQNNDWRFLYLVEDHMQLEGISKIASAIGHIPLNIFDIKNNRITSPTAVTVTSLLHNDCNVEY